MEWTVLEVAEILIRKIQNTNDTKEWIEYIEDRPFNDKRYFISNEKLKKLGWNIETDFITGLNMMLRSV